MRGSACTPSARPSKAPSTSSASCSSARASSYMYVIVVGGGTVGYYLSRDLVERGHEVTLIERDAKRADWLETQLGSIVRRGEGCEVRFLAETGIERADAIIPGTAADGDNRIARKMA